MPRSQLVGEVGLLAGNMVLWSTTITPPQPKGHSRGVDVVLETTILRTSFLPHPEGTLGNKAILGLHMSYAADWGMRFLQLDLPLGQHSYESIHLRSNSTLDNVVQ